MMTLRSSTSLQSDLSRFIFPLARSLRHDKVSGAVTDASPVGSVTASGRHNAAEYVKPEGFCKSHQRTPGVRKTVTYFSPHMNALLNRPFGSTGTIDINVPLYQCPICSCGSSAEGDIKRHMQPWMDPQEMTRHMSWLHASSGYTQSNFSIYNAGEMRRLCKSLPCSSADDPSEETAMKPRVVLMLDVANIELSLEDVLIQLLTSEESILFFSRVACAIVCVHEVFIPHTSRPGHIFFQLSRLNALSDIFTLYAATRIESGDLLSAALMGELLFQDMRGCAPSIVLLTKDQQQKLCVSNMFSGVAGRGARVFLPRITAQSILCCLREANLASMGL
ncbi:hypothetical protein DPX39_070020000 [Trypanosoma brucei equiperdum]|uniref:Uncharacterized protein n=1 Tax=Trypanosoma brucei equiperdum TaxID=630700 RepID=A0A3L6L6Q2_9TRYP|nr:hypothetical protein DPX39_070020000 [Trypanosoma brucei equiperdum]